MVFNVSINISNHTIKNGKRSTYSNPQFPALCVRFIDKLFRTNENNGKTNLPLNNQSRIWHFIRQKNDYALAIDNQ